VQRSGYRAQTIDGSDGDFTDLFDLALATPVDFAGATPIFTFNYKRAGTWVFDGCLFVRDSLSEAFSVTLTYSATDTSAVIQLGVDAPVAANNAAGDVFTTNAVGGTTGTFAFTSTANFARVMRLFGLLTIVASTPGAFVINATKSAGAGTTSMRIGSRLRGARVPD
jgi:hypothetical protein